MQQIIEVIVSPQGQTRLQTRGFSGGGCRLASQFIEDALGGRLAEQVTAEMYQQLDQAAACPASQRVTEAKSS